MSLSASFPGSRRTARLSSMVVGAGSMAPVEPASRSDSRHLDDPPQESHCLAAYCRFRPPGTPCRLSLSVWMETKHIIAVNLLPRIQHSNTTNVLARRPWRGWKRVARGRQRQTLSDMRYCINRWCALHFRQGLRLWSRRHEHGWTCK